LLQLCLNSLWGRFSLRNRLSRTIITDDVEKYFDLINDITIELNGIEQLNEDAISITYTPKEEFVIENASSNIVK